MRTIRTVIIFAVLSVFTFACETKHNLKPGEEYADLTHGKVWYRIVGGGTGVPLLLLHGGPGYPSHYLNPLAELAKDRPVIFLDQLGCGRSGSLTDTTLMNIDSFVVQLEEFRAALGLDEFYLYGHSWGTMLGVDYYLKYPEHIKAMILASPCLSAERWTNDANDLIATLPDSIQESIRIHNEQGTYDSPEYQEAVMIFYQQYVARKSPWDANLDSAFSGSNATIYNHMWGPSEFRSTGNLRNYDRTADLNRINVPVLYVCGEHDEARPATVQYYQSVTPGSRLAVIPGAAHATMHDNQAENNKAISDFLSEVARK